MNEHLYRWRNRELREHVSVIDGNLAPSILIKNITYLNVFLKQWIKAHIWVYQDRIVYVGDKLPTNVDETEIIDANGKYAVPGYVEPHAHPFQLYNPHQLAKYASQTGTTVLINDNLMWLFLLKEKEAFSLLDEFTQLPVSMYWWSRYDCQSIIQEEHDMFGDEKVLRWINHPAVMQGGELTAWPQVMKDDDHILYWMQETKRLRKPIEGHFPGASESTLVKMLLLGASADHESITGQEAYDRIRLGYQVGLRHSSIRPDLPKLLDELQELGVRNFDMLTLTTDGSTPSFYKDGMINELIRIAIEKGIPLEEAYRMATYNAAKHFHMDDRFGSIAPGRVAHINILEQPDNPTPTSVLAKGQWIRKNGQQVSVEDSVQLDSFFKKLDLDWDLCEDDMQFSLPIGMKMTNDVIMKPYPINIDPTVEKIPSNFDEAFLMLVDRQGRWRINTLIDGFTSKLGGMVTSYSTTGDIACIGKSKKDIQLAFDRMKEMGGGIVLVDEGEVLFELSLPLAGIMYDGDMEELIEKELHLKKLLKDFGYKFHDPVFTLLFLSSTHLPYIRITPKGIVDVKKKEVLFPSIMR
ncbi:amidohydrolase family protein [Radiobacillus kanasensis]|uniref:adenine deaminase C-terminal domain-containing protein n=1 Tax=Radiobacillus kanasensis TaxID=2844358 RepID=UPI001E35E8C2|nr:adenine deaminase C-terminal domain-containing protein [Radiobacillus kanasensis]UFT99918.1 amidohydrolase family protein [Radiobacillus kanasensis]